MRILIVASLAAATGSAAAPPPPLSERPPTLRLEAAPGKECRRPDVHLTAPAQRPEAKPLGELPPGDVVLSVYNQVDGCMEPVIVRYGDGRQPAPRSVQPLPTPQR